MSLQLHYTGQDYINRGLAGGTLTPGSTSAIVGGCKTGKGFAFDGTVNSALSESLALNYDEFSLSCWFMITATPPPAGRNVIFATNPNSQNRFILDVDNNNVIRFIVFFGSVASFTIVLGSVATLNKWYHVAATCDDLNKIIRIFVDGTLINQASYVGVLNIANYFSIGSRIGTAQYFNGKICNLKVYNHVLSAREIAEDYKSLMLHYKLDKPITTEVFDHSGFNRHISVIENTTTNSTTEKRVYGGSLANNGTQSLYGSLNLTELNGINEISVAVRFRFIQQEGFHCYFSSRTTVSGDGINLFKPGGSRIDFYVDIAGRNIFTLPYDLVTGSWYDLVAVKSTTDVKLYINGSLIDTISNTNSISNMGQLYAAISINIADDSLTLANVMNGNVQDIRFYATALTEQDVKDLYNVRHSIDKNGNYYTYELIEGETSVGMKKNGQTNCDELIENEDGSFSIKSDTTIKVNNIKEI